MGYSITVQELIKRPIIRTDFDEEWMNKMTDDELNKFDKESYDISIKEGTIEKYLTSMLLVYQNILIDVYYIICLNNNEFIRI